MRSVCETTTRKHVLSFLASLLDQMLNCRRSRRCDYSIAPSILSTNDAVDSSATNDGAHAVCTTAGLHANAHAGLHAIYTIAYHRRHFSQPISTPAHQRQGPNRPTRRPRTQHPSQKRMPRRNQRHHAPNRHRHQLMHKCNQTHAAKRR